MVLRRFRFETINAYHMSNNQENKVALILGGTGDIGSAIGDSFEKEGYIVCRHGRTRGDYTADLSQDGASKRLIDQVVSKHGRIDIVVNAISAPIVRESFEEKHWSDFCAHFDVQLRAAVETSLHVLPVMRKQNYGKIVHILTVYVQSAIASGFSDYITSKYALWGLTRSLAKEFGKYNITVNAVSPGFVDNNFNKASPQKVGELVAHTTPLRRLTTNNDVARVVLFLVSPDADFMTGQNIVVSGGADI